MNGAQPHVDYYIRSTFQLQGDRSSFKKVPTKKRTHGEVPRSIPSTAGPERLCGAFPML